MKKIIAFLILTFIFTVCVFSQEKRMEKSKNSSKSARCASLFEEYKSIEVKQLKGRVDSPLEIPIVIEIYKISKNVLKDDAYKLTYNKIPNKIYEY